MTPAQLMQLLHGEGVLMGAKQPTPAMSDVDDLARFQATGR